MLYARNCDLQCIQFSKNKKRLSNFLKLYPSVMNKILMCPDKISINDSFKILPGKLLLRQFLIY